MIRAWKERSDSSLGLKAYFLAHTKPCPECKVVIEKNQVWACYSAIQSTYNVEKHLAQITQLHCGWAQEGTPCS